jgi:hypothetical protein
LTETTFHELPLSGHAPSTLLRTLAARRLRVLFAHRRLDRQIAAGCHYDSNPMLALRAGQLLRRRTRLRLARAVRGAVAHADACDASPALSGVVIRRDAVKADREALFGLAERLESAAPVSARGVVLVGELLTDGVGSPLFSRNCGRSVAEAVWTIADALCDGTPESIFDVR